MKEIEEGTNKSIFLDPGSDFLCNNKSFKILEGIWRIFSHLESHGTSYTQISLLEKISPILSFVSCIHAMFSQINGSHIEAKWNSKLNGIAS